MSLKKSQDYLYFQNKASHYHNITSAKSRLDTKIPNSLRNTIDYHDIVNTSKHLPHLRQFDIKFTNQTMLKRIQSRDKSPLNKHITYARYNSFERGFRNRNPKKNQQQRLIDIQNEKMRKSIQKAKAEVGSIQNWKRNYDQNLKHSRLKSKFSGTKAKDQLIIQTQRFLPQRYLKYLQQAQVEHLQENSLSKSKIKGKLQVQKLFILPQLQSPKSTELSPLTSKQILVNPTKNNIQSRPNLETLSNNNQTIN